MKPQTEILEHMRSVFKDIPRSAWDQSKGVNPREMLSLNSSLKESSLKDVMSTPCCFGAKIVGYLDTEHPDFLNGDGAPHSYLDAMRALVKLMGTTGFHIHRALVDAGAPIAVFGTTPYRGQASQAAVFDKLVSLEKMPKLTDFDFSEMTGFLDKGDRVQDLDFTGSHITNFSFDETRIKNVKFDKCRLKDVLFDETRIEGCSFRGAEFENGSAWKTVCKDTSFRGAAVDSYMDLRESKFHNCDFSGIKELNADFDRCEFHNCNFTGALFKTTDCAVSARGTLFADCKLSKAQIAYIEKEGGRIIKGKEKSK